MKISIITSIEQCTAEAWNSLWRATCPDAYPFLRFEFLAALERSGCVGGQSEHHGSGWQSQHLLVHNSNDELIAALPLYLKFHSYGEYVFDWGWAEAWQKAGLNYYPKLVNAIPFTPCAGPRLLLAEGTISENIWPNIDDFLQRYAAERRISGWHSLFLPQQDSAVLQTQNKVQRLGCQFQWINHNYKNFDDFLASMNSRKRKSIKKEREKVRNQGIHFKILQGLQITEGDWAHFHYFYQATYAKLSGHGGYLKAEFFHSLTQAMRDQVVLVAAYSRDNEMIAAALYFKGDDALFGRYWGCLEEYDFLHFETCYYQGIEFAIAQSLQRFDAGAQGEHKIQRGFQPIYTYSNHWVAEAGFQPAVADFVKREAVEIKNYYQSALQYLPFKIMDTENTQ